METSFFSNSYKKYILLFPLGILVGSVIMNLAGISKINEWELFNKAIEEMPSFQVVLSLVLKERLGHFVVIFLMCFSTLKDKLFLVFVGWMGLSMGMIQSVFIIQYGFFGVLLYVFSIGLHCLIYFLATMGLLVISERSEKQVFSLSMCFVLVSYLLGIIIEVCMSWCGLFYVLNFMNYVDNNIFKLVKYRVNYFT